MCGRLLKRLQNMHTAHKASEEIYQLIKKQNKTHPKHHFLTIELLIYGQMSLGRILALRTMLWVTGANYRSYNRKYNTFIGTGKKVLFVFFLDTL